MSGTGTVLSVECLTVRRGNRTVLSGLTAHWEAGGFHALIGPSGGGKTTLLRTVAGLEKPVSGTVRIGNRVLSGGSTHVPPHQRGVAMVFQDLALWPHMGALAQVRLAGAGHPAQLLEQCGFRGRHSARPHDLSGGERQRVALARSLASSPQWLLLDEPFSNLDTPSRWDLIRLVRDQTQRQRLSALYVTHHWEDLRDGADSLSVLDSKGVRKLPPGPWTAETLAACYDGSA